jgi:hypothetical protein
MFPSFTLDLFSRFSSFLIGREQDVGQRNSPFTCLVIKIPHRRLHADPIRSAILAGEKPWFNQEAAPFFRATSLIICGT